MIGERYDRDLTADPIRRRHQEDFCQALGLPADNKYQQEGGPTVAQSAELIRRCTPIPAQELPRLISAVAFNCIVGNCDAHGKNYSLLYDRGAPTLARLYDIVSTFVYPELTTRLAMSIGRARHLEEVDDGSWVKHAGDAGYRPAFVTKTVNDLLKRAAVEAPTLIGTSAHDNDTAPDQRAHPAPGEQVAVVDAPCRSWRLRVAWAASTPDSKPSPRGRRRDR